MISVSIVSHSQKDLVLDLFKDFERLKPPLVTQIILTHNLTDDRKEFPDRIGHIEVSQIYRGTQLGFGANHNRAFTTTSNQLFAVLNPDLRFEIDPFTRLVSSLNLISTGLIAPQIVNRDNTVEDSARGLYTPLDSLSGLRRKSRLHRENPAWIAGMFVLFRSKAFTQINGFDERYFMYVEDVDICARLVIAGWSLKYESSVNVTHLARRENRKSLTHFVWHLSSALRWWSGRVFWAYRRKLKRASA